MEVRNPEDDLTDPAVCLNSIVKQRLCFMIIEKRFIYYCKINN